MSPLPAPISSPSPLVYGPVAVRVITRRDARELNKLLALNHEWLSPWEATFPGTPASSAQNTRYIAPVSQVLKSLRAQQRSGSGIVFAVLDGGEVVGQLSVNDISGGACRSAAIGYWISQHAAGRGITPVAVALTIDYLFNQLQLHRVEICIRPENNASLRVVQKLGMRYEGRRERYIHIAGEWCDHDCFAVTREEVPRGMLHRLNT